MLYVVKCPNCSKTDEVFCPVSERHNQVCSECGTKMALQIQPVTPMWYCDSTSGTSINHANPGAK